MKIQSENIFVIDKKDEHDIFNSHRFYVHWFEPLLVIVSLSLSFK